MPLRRGSTPRVNQTHKPISVFRHIAMIGNVAVQVFTAVLPMDGFLGILLFQSGDVSGLSVVLPGCPSDPRYLVNLSPHPYLYNIPILAEIHPYIH
ncbi:hypothetical protein [Nostoc phage N1]|nr:hypothetical protein [Nostoc phage N1]